MSTRSPPCPACYFGFVWCRERETVMRNKPLAIDIDAERAKLATLKGKRAEVAQRASKALTACSLQYPEQ